jgi:hypothetical protein
MTSTAPRGTFGSVASLLAATLYQIDSEWRFRKTTLIKASGLSENEI